MSKPKLLVIGRTSTGKDTLAAEMEKLGLSFVKSYSTRPKRTPDEDTHIFVNEEEADMLWDDAAASTTINGIRYFATRQQVEDNDAYIIDPAGMYELLSNMPDTAFSVIYLKTNRAESRRRALERVSEERREFEAKVFDAREASENAQFCDFEKTIERGTVALPDNVKNVYIYVNDFSTDILEKAAKDILSHF